MFIQWHAKDYMIHGINSFYYRLSGVNHGCISSSDAENMTAEQLIWLYSTMIFASVWWNQCYGFTVESQETRLSKPMNEVKIQLNHLRNADFQDHYFWCFITNVVGLASAVFERRWRRKRKQGTCRGTRQRRENLGFF